MLLTNFKRTKYACYFSSLSMAAISSLSPLLFVTFKELYGISYSLLGLLVVVNFCTQLILDVVLSFVSNKIKTEKVLPYIPLFTVVGLFIYALFPVMMPGLAYIWLVVGTVLFASSAGFAEALINPVIMAIPSDNPDKEMSRYHSVFAWGCVAVVILSTVYLNLFGSEYWYGLALIWAAFPLTSFLLFIKAPMPELQSESDNTEKKNVLKSSALFFCVLSMFFGGAAENTMTQWCSGYVENALGIPKIWGDICGMALFACMLGLGRTLYSKFGKNALSVVTWGFIGSAICYVVAALSNLPILSLMACALTGLCTSMLWPGNLIVVADLIPCASVAVYAWMAVGGDLGGSVVPQMVGIIADSVSESGWLPQAFSTLTPEQFGLKIGILSATVFPILGALTVKLIKHKFYEKETK